MKKNIKRILSIALMVFLIAALLTTVYATKPGSTVKDKFSGSDASTIEGADAITKIISAVLGIVRTAGAAVAVLILMTIAAKYIMASAGDRADIKKYAVNYIIGAIILFGTSGILGLVKDFVDNSIKYGG